MSQGMLGKLPLSAWQRLRDDLEQKLAGEDGVIWLEALKWLLNGEDPWAKLPQGFCMVPMFPLWMTISVGGMSTDALIVEMESNGIKVMGMVRDMMNQEEFVTSNDVVGVSLIRVKVADLGFEKGAPWKIICHRAELLGLKRCRPAVGPHLRLADYNQLPDDRYSVGMEPIATFDCCPRVFSVGHSVVGGRLLFSNASSPSCLWNPEEQVVIEAGAMEDTSVRLDSP